MSGVELLPCAFCQSINLTFVQISAGGGWGVLCRNCHTTKDTRCEHQEDAARGWNTRTTPAQGLDAATIERCAQVAEQQRYTHKHPNAGMDHEMEMHDDGCMAAAAAIRALNTASTTTRGEKNDE